MWQACINAIIGLWLIVAAFMGFGPTANLWDNLLVGFTVLSVSFAAIKNKPWQSWLALVLAAWMIASAFVPTLVGGAGYIYNDFISGIIIAVTGFASFGGANPEKLA